MKFRDESPQFFQDAAVPNGASLAGWAALVHGLDIEAPVRRPACISMGYIRGSQRQDGAWSIYDKRYHPDTDIFAHLSFAMRHEDIDLLILKRTFSKVDKKAVAAFIKSAPTGQINRKIWFFYEFLMGETLDIGDAKSVAAIDALDPKLYVTTEPILSKRHRVRDNLLGVQGFCPIIKRSEHLELAMDRRLDTAVAATIGKTGKHLIARAASFLLLADSKASFEIEGERPPKDRFERWGRAILQAGKHQLNRQEIYRLHETLLGDDRFTQEGYRSDGVFLGDRDPNSDPLPEFIGAKAGDIDDLMSALIACNDRLRISSIDAVLHAAIIAFGFVYIHPLEDGNGRLHRYLIHHVLAHRKFAPPGIVFPLSNVMLDEIEAYRKTLQTHSGPLMEYIEWRTTPDHNVEVTNDTTDLYSYFDATGAAEFLYTCVQRTIDKDFPREIAYLSARDQAQRRIMEYIEMPDRKADDLIMFIRNNDGTLPKRRRSKEFEALTDDEVRSVEGIIAEAFAEFDEAGHS